MEMLPTPFKEIEKESTVSAENESCSKNETMSEHIIESQVNRSSLIQSTYNQTEHRSRNQGYYSLSLSLFVRAEYELKWSNHWFTLNDHQCYDDENIQILDIRRTFVPQNKAILGIIYRFIWLSASTIFWIYTIKQNDWNILISLSYLTNLTFTLTFIYQILSYFLTLCDKGFICSRNEVNYLHQPQFNNESHMESQRPSRLVCITWALYNVSLAGEFLVMIGYWALVYNGSSVDIINLYRHLFISFLLLIDGHVICRIPIRLKFFIFFLLYLLSWAIWTIIYAFLKINGGATLYDFLDWIDKPFSTLCITLFLGFIVSPMIFFFLWLLSLWSNKCDFDGGRRFYLSQNSNHDVEMSSSAIDIT
mmetsp:Transcript_6314/g.9175  ORF Transcript_6314/g.9175 Transcript_6314/m.9175 type:complete len:364 (-) Transcript_6314:322-1413(-)